MKRLQRFLAMLLCLCVTAGMLTLPAAAATVLNRVRLTIEAPRSGKQPAATASLPKNARSVVQDVRWSGQLDTDGTFMPRVKYTVTVTLGIKRGEDCIFSDKSIHATVNDKEADEVLWYADDLVEVIYTFPAHGTSNILTFAHITMDAPSVGARPAVSAHTPATASTYVHSIRWDGPLDSGGRFQAGTEYTAYLSLRVKDEYAKRKFSSKTFDAVVNGVTIDEVTRVSDKELVIPVEFEKLPGAAPAPETVPPAQPSIAVPSAPAAALEEVRLTITAPEAGNVPAKTAGVPAGSSYYVKDVAWTGPLSGGTFQSGGSYTASITLGIPDGVNARFSDQVMNAYVNGELISEVIWFSDREIMVPCAFTPVPEVVRSQFTDVPAASPYAAPIAWAVSGGITDGTSPTTFSPDSTCSQAQILTFLWRAKGSPEPQGTMELQGVSAGQYYYKPSLWAAEQGLLAEGDYYPDAPCTRAMAVTYLWKLAGSPAAAAAGFADVPANADYAQAVAWAVASGVTNGTSATTFAPGGTCTRGQIVTFLYRAIQ